MTPPLLSPHHFQVLTLILLSIALLAASALIGSALAFVLTLAITITAAIIPRKS